jgi:pantoate--beta-alanine ligase
MARTERHAVESDSPPMEVLRSTAAVQRRCLAWRAQGLRVGLVPTMGYLHDGHLSLVAQARELADRVVVSIFVNPTQFGPNEDLAAYPRDEAGDLAKLRREGAALVFCPPPAEIYPAGAETTVALARLPAHLCGLSRPVHFGGVATVVTKLLVICLPHVAVFGEKDYQQLLVIRRLTRDLLFPTEIVAGATVREADGLAMSSRNAYLSPDDRARASVLYEALCEARAAVQGGARDMRELTALMRQRIAARGGEVDYVAIVDEETLDDISEVSGFARDRGIRAALAVRFGRTRLIDNLRLS